MDFGRRGDCTSLQYTSRLVSMPCSYRMQRCLSDTHEERGDEGVVYEHRDCLYSHLDRRTFSVSTLHSNAAMLTRTLIVRCLDSQQKSGRSIHGKHHRVGDMDTIGDMVCRVLRCDCVLHYDGSGSQPGHRLNRTHCYIPSEFSVSDMFGRTM